MPDPLITTNGFMVQLKNLRFLSSQKVKDAETLLRKGRNTGAIYMMGYALEFSLKRKISQTLGFTNGFPESKAELMLYTPQLSVFNNLNIGSQLTHISQIRHHKLQDLLVFSGVQYRINVRLMSEWQIVNNWNPEHRYVRQRITSQKAQVFVTAAKRLIQEIA